MATERNYFDFRQENMTSIEVAEYTRLSKKTIDTYRGKGTGPKFIKLGRKVFYKKSDVDAWIEENSGLTSTGQARLRKRGF